MAKVKEESALDVAVRELADLLNRSVPLALTSWAPTSVAEYEREMIRERVVAGLRKAKANGKHVGRPKAVLNRLRVEQLREEGLSWREIGRKMHLPKSTVYRYRGVHQVELTTC